MNATREDTPRVLALALGLWAAAVSAGAIGGVFTRLSPGEMAALGLFGFAFAVAATWLDRGVREWLDAISPRALFTALVEVDVLISVSAMLAMALVDGRFEAALTRFPLALIVLFVAPVAAAAHIVGVARLLRTRPAKTRYASIEQG